MQENCERIFVVSHCLGDLRRAIETGSPVAQHRDAANGREWRGYRARRPQHGVQLKVLQLLPGDLSPAEPIGRVEHGFVAAARQSDELQFRRLSRRHKALQPCRSLILRRRQDLRASLLLGLAYPRQDVADAGHDRRFRYRRGLSVAICRLSEIFKRLRAGQRSLDLFGRHDDNRRLLFLTGVHIALHNALRNAITIAAVGGQA